MTEPAPEDLGDARATDASSVRHEADRLAGLAQLEDIIYFETSAKRKEPTEPPAAIMAENPPDTEIPIQVKIGQDETFSRLLVRISAEITSADATFRVEVGAQFVMTESVETSPEVQVAFAGQTAMGVLMPYLRETLMSMASRMRVPAPLLPLVQPRNAGAVTAENMGVHD